MEYDYEKMPRSKEEAMKRGERMYYDEGNPCDKGHPPIKKINSLTPLKAKCYECLLESGRRKAARMRADPERKAIVAERIARINRERYRNDPEFRESILNRVKERRKGVKTPSSTE